MSDDPLRQLLREADAAAGAPPKIAGDLAPRVRVLARRRQRIGFGYSAAAALALAVGLTYLFAQVPAQRRGDGGAPLVRAGESGRPEAARLEAELDRLNREAELRLAVARRTEEILRQLKRVEAARRRQQTIPDVVANARREVDQAAFVLVSHADRMCREMDLCESAAVKYRRVVDLFPDSRWAAVARQRLSALKNRGEI